MRSIFSNLLFLIIGLMLAGVFIAAHLYVYSLSCWRCLQRCRFYLLERPEKGKSPADGQIRRSYHRGGLEDSMYWAASIGIL